MALDNQGLHLVNHQWKVPKLVFQVNYLTRIVLSSRMHVYMWKKNRVCHYEF